MSLDSVLTLNNGIEIPQLGSAQFKIPAEETRAAVLAALERQATATSTPRRCTATKSAEAGG